MSGYCEECGSALCVCDEIADSLNKHRQHCADEMFFNGTGSVLCGLFGILSLATGFDIFGIFFLWFSGFFGAGFLLYFRRFTSV